VTPMGIGGFAAMRAPFHPPTTNPSAPLARGQKPGWVRGGRGRGRPGDRGAESARARGANVLAEVVGYGMSADAFHLTPLRRMADGAFRVMRNAMKNAGIEPSRVDYINAHGTSTEVGDRVETVAIKRAFGEHAYKVAVSSTKSMMGHPLARRRIEARHRRAGYPRPDCAPTINYETPDPDCDLDYVPNQARPMKIDYALSNSFGFGGTNGCLIFKRYSE